MIKLTETSRKILRAIYKGLGAVAISLSITACPPWYFYPDTPVMYGPGPPYEREEILVTGRIISKTTKNPIYGIAVYINDIKSDTRSYYNGDFYFWLQLPLLDNYTFIFTDIDGEANGGRFKQLTRNITKEEIENLSVNPLIIELEEETDD